MLTTLQNCDAQSEKFGQKCFYSKEALLLLTKLHHVAKLGDVAEGWLGTKESNVNNSGTSLLHRDSDHNQLDLPTLHFPTLVNDDKVTKDCQSKALSKT